jgi:iron complex outermembrane receptor protein
MAWTPGSDTTWWSSLARAARTPSRFELDIPYAIGETAAVPPSVGNPFGVPAIQTVRLPPPAGTLKAEQVTTFELGFRQRATPQLSLDLVAFVSDYSQLVSFNTLTPQFVSPSLVVVPVTNGNEATARTHGVEVAADWQVNPSWRIQPSYSRLYLSSPRLADPVETTVQEWWEGRVPRDRASLRSSWTLGDGSQLDLWLKYTSSLSNPQVPAYTVLDLRYAFHIGRQMDIAIVGQNLLDQRHPEFVSDYLPTQQTEIGRSLMVKGTWRF